MFFFSAHAKRAGTKTIKLQKRAERNVEGFFGARSAPKIILRSWRAKRATRACVMPRCFVFATGCSAYPSGWRSRSAESSYTSPPRFWACGNGSESRCASAPFRPDSLTAAWIASTQLGRQPPLRPQRDQTADSPPIRHSTQPSPGRPQAESPKCRPIGPVCGGVMHNPG